MVKEIIKLCSRKHPSISRNTSPQALIKLRIEDVCEEWLVKAPIFYDFLKSAAIPSKRSDVAQPVHHPSVAVACAVLLRERCKEMNAIQHLISMIIKFSSYQVRETVPLQILACKVTVQCLIFLCLLEC